MHERRIQSKETKLTRNFSEAFREDPQMRRVSKELDSALKTRPKSRGTGGRGVALSQEVVGTLKEDHEEAEKLLSKKVETLISEKHTYSFKDEGSKEGHNTSFGDKAVHTLFRKSEAIEKLKQDRLVQEGKDISVIESEPISKDDIQRYEIVEQPLTFASK